MAEDVVAMLSPSRRQELALDVLGRTGPRMAERVVQQVKDEIGRTEERLATMREEMAQLTDCSANDDRASPRRS
jgi:hypothetical protein